MACLFSLRFTVVITVATVFCVSTRSVMAEPVLETLYTELSPLDGASSLPGFTPNDTVRDNGQRKVTANPRGDFITAVNTDRFQGNTIAAGTFYHFGSTTGGTSPTALRREQNPLAGQNQLAFGDTSAIDYNGVTLYTATLENPNAPPSRLSSLWQDDTPIAIRGDAIPAGPLAGSFFNGFGSSHRSGSGVNSWSSSYATTSLGSTAGVALFRDSTTFDTLLKSGDAIGSLGTIESDAFAITNPEFSIGGNSYIAEVTVEMGGNSTEVAVVNGSPMMFASGGFVASDASIPVADGGLAGETIGSLTLSDVNEAGDYLFASFTDGVSDDEDEVIIHNGKVLHRVGDFVDGVELKGQAEGVAINDLGDIAFVWGDTLFVNDKVVATVGTLVDTTGDGVGDAPIGGNFFSLDELEITNLPAAGGDGLPVLYVSANVVIEFFGDPFAATSLLRLPPAPELAGDYNGDGTVDAADYTVWRESLGSEVLLAADGDGNLIIDEADFLVWRTNYGATLGAGAGTQSVPEPTTLGLLVASVGLLTLRRRR